MSRVRQSLQDVCDNYTSKKDVDTLNNLIRAFRKIQQVDPTDPDSFFVIAGYHGEPFVAENPHPDDSKYDDWWGGYCQHQTILFPTWHRAYLLRLEEALRKAVPDVTDLALPFLDECRDFGQGPVLPWILTQPTFDLDGDSTNPLYSYKFQKGIADNHDQKLVDPQRYTKPAGYQTVRYPLSGLVSPKDIEATDLHNARFTDAAQNTDYLNRNVAAWLTGSVQIDQKLGDKTPIPNTISVVSRYKGSLLAPNYTVFSNKASMGQWKETHLQSTSAQGNKPNIPFQFNNSLEDPHNAIHLAIGGFYQKDVLNANPIEGAQGDMGENETAGFDPIFYLHHAFVDYVFWTWQIKHKLTQRGSLTVDPSITQGTSSPGGPTFPLGVSLDMDSPLAPFLKSGTPSQPVYLTSKDVTDITELGYTYGKGSLDLPTQGPVLGTPDLPLKAVARVSGISTRDHSGSFVIRTTATLPDGREVEIDRDAILSRWVVSNCKNCEKNKIETHTYFPFTEGLMKAIGAERKEDIKDKLTVYVQTRDHIKPVKGGLGAAEPLIEIF